MTQAEDLRYKEHTTPKFSKENLKYLVDYYKEKEFTKVEISFFAPFSGYQNSNDRFNESKQKEYLSHAEDIRNQAVPIVNEFIAVFNSMTPFKFLSYGIYDPKIFKDTLWDSVNKCLAQMNERIDQQASYKTFLVFLIDEKYMKDFKFEEKLSFVNYIVYRS